MYNGMQVYRAVVTSSSSTTGSLYVSIPSVLGTSTSIAVSTIGRAAVSGVWTVPDVGDQVLVAVEDDKFSNVFLLYPVETSIAPDSITAIELAPGSITTTELSDGSVTLSKGALNTTISNFAYKVGDTGPGGGIIFFVDRYNEYAGFTYLEVAPVSTQVQRTWTPSIYQFVTVTGADSKALGAGHQNTIDIVNQGHTNPATSAAKYCADLVFGGQSDWYLGSLAEMMAISEVLYFQLGVGGFLPAIYWSSSEDAENYAWGQIFSSFSPYLGDKGNTYYVRPVRRF